MMLREGSKVLWARGVHFVSEWQDLDFERQTIHVRRTWLDGRIGQPKANARGQPVAMGAALADIMKRWRQETAYAKPSDWVFASARLRRKKPRTGSVMAQDYLRPAALKMGILTVNDRRRFGFLSSLTLPIARWTSGLEH
jgi:integrase